ncbi:DUF4432 domain-containing protein [Kaistia sp. 32K]|uniref:DUF4432 family protein n=1 Tax=Kaistia sp. 32K TaxID=2795690 RepID=UPI0019161CF6|nr:DUF4432 family protein [Kaistia sp. 32K]BCP56116.1 DUF4432 domain-containing protein [Kaistia sp. 32K]
MNQQFLDRLGDISQAADISLMSAEDGPARGARFLVGRTFSGLHFRIAVDRGFDLCDLDFRGVALGWRGPQGFAAPALHAPDGEDGLAFVRAFSGFLITCGWDHYGPARTGPQDHFGYALKAEAKYPLHGRATFIPASHVSFGVDLDAENGPCVFAEAILRQTAMFGEQIEIRRRYTFGIERPEVNLVDHVRNIGRKRTPHRVLYHVNLGYPLVDDGTVITGLPEDPRMPAICEPLDPAGTEQFRAIDRALCADEITVHQPRIAGGLTFTLAMRSPSFSHVVEWYNRYPGMNVIGIEPASAPMPEVTTAPFEPDAWLEPGERQTYHLTFKLNSEGDRQ